MAKVTISIEGTPDEVTEYIQRLIDARVPQQALGVSWLPEEIENLFTNLQPEAQRILHEVAKKPEGYDRDELITQLGITGRGLAGRLSSVEFTRKRLFPSKPRPIELDWGFWKYTMLPEVVDWIKANAER